MDTAASLLQYSGPAGELPLRHPLAGIRLLSKRTT